MSTTVTGVGTVDGNTADPNTAEVKSKPFKSYIALLNQSGTDAPTVNILENTIGDIIWTRNGEGLYRGTLTDAFTGDRTVLPPFTSVSLMPLSNLTIGYYNLTRQNSSEIRLYSYADLDYNSVELGSIIGPESIYIEVRVYPTIV